MVVPNTKFTTFAYYGQLVANFVALGAVVTVLFVVNANFARQATQQTASNQAVILEMQRDLDVHAHASAARSCANAKELQTVIAYQLKLSHLSAPKFTRQLQELVDQACLVVPIGPGEQ
jgi:uncharacterized membrane protein